LNIPQIEVEIKYSTRVKDSNTFTEEGTEQNIIEYFDVRVFDDGTYISVEKDDLIFQIIEEKTYGISRVLFGICA
jgi:hypothetical protein